MSIRSKGFIAAMEDEEVIDMSGVAEEEVPAGVEMEVTDVADEGGDLADDVEALEDAIEDTETLDQIADLAAASAEEGEGMDPVAAEITEVAVEAIYARLGLTQKAMPSMESFGSAGSRKAATRIAAEGWKESVKKAWDAVVKFFKNIIEKIMAFLDKFFNANTRLMAAAKKMLASVNAKEGTQTGEVKSAAAKGFAAKSGTVGAREIEGVLTLHTEIVGSFTKASALAGKMVNSFAGVSVKSSADAAAMKSLVEQEIESKGAEVSTVMESVAKKGTQGGHLLYGGYEFKFDDALKTGEKKGFFKGTMDFVRGAVSEGKEVKITPLSKPEMVSVVNKVSELGQANADFKKIQKDLTNIMNSVVKIANSVANIAEKNTDEEGKKAVSEMRNAATATGSFIAKGSSRLPAMNVAAGKAALNVVAACLATYKVAA
jgi:hypothetical protein